MNLDCLIIIDIDYCNYLILIILMYLKSIISNYLTNIWIIRIIRIIVIIWIIVILQMCTSASALNCPVSECSLGRMSKLRLAGVGTAVSGAWRAVGQRAGELRAHTMEHRS